MPNKRIMKKLISLLIIAFSALSLSAQGGDPCAATPVSVTVGACTFSTYTNQGATDSGIGSPGCASYNGGDVWFSVTVPLSGSLVFDSNTGDITDGGMAVYNSPTNDCNNLTMIECDDDGSANGAMSFIEQNGLTPGATIWIRFWEYGGNNNGTFDLCVWEPGPPPNDGPCTAVDLTPSPMCALEEYDTGNATDSGVADPGCANYNGADIWFSATVPPSGIMYIETGAIEVTEGGLAIYNSPTNDCTDLVLNQCIDNGNMPFVTLNSLTPGDILWIRFWENGGDNNGLFDICVTNTSGPPDCSSALPASDDCSTATPICSLEGYCGNTSDSYTQGNNDPGAFCGSIENSSWISFQAGATTAVLYVWTMNCQNNNGIQMEIYETSDCINYTSVSDCISTGTMEDFAVTATGLVVGDTYYLMIDGWGGDVCDYVVSAGEGVMTATAIVAETGTNTASICSGCVNLQASGGTGYEWSPAATLDNPNISNPEACPLVTTTYTVTVTGGNPDCPSNATATTTVFIEADFTTEITNTELLCHDDATASITATVNNQGQSSSFNFEWSTSEISGMIPDTTYTITNLSAGTYSVTVTEELGCSSVHTVTIDNPPALSMDFTTVSEYCGMETGIINATITDGTAPYSFSWLDTGSGTTNGNSTSANNPFSIPNLEAGNYVIDVVDDNGCPVIDNVSVSDSGSVTAGFNISNNQCLEGNSFDFTNTSTVTNGIVYTLTAPNSLPQTLNGTPGYTGFIADQHGIWNIRQNISSGACTDEVNLTFEVFEEPVLTESHVDITCNAFSDAVITAISTIPGDFSMISGAGIFVGNIASSLDLGLYTFMVQTPHGCNDTLSVTLTEPDVLSLDATSTDLECFGVCNGTATAIVLSGGTAPYSYNWGSSGNQQTATDLCTGLHTVTVTDYKGCTETVSTTINQASELTLSSSSVPVKCFGESNGSARVEAQGGTPVYEYLWPNNSPENVIINVPANYYEVTVTDANGCVKTMGIDVEQPSPVILGLEYEPSICIGQTAEIRMSVTSSPFSPYTFYWNGVTSSDIITVQPNQTTIYSAQAEDAHGCKSFISDVEVIVNPPITLHATADKSRICQGDIVNVDTHVSGGNGNYFFRLLGAGALYDPIVLKPEIDTEYKIIAYDNCGSPEDTVSFFIEVDDPYLPSFHADKESGCTPLKVDFIQDISTHEQGTSYQWAYSDQSTSNMSFEANGAHTFINPGSYNISLKITTNLGCESEYIAYQYIHAFPVPKAAFTPTPPVSSILKPVIYFENNSEDADLAYWSFGDGEQSSAISPEHQYNATVSDYSVRLIAMNRFTCSDTTYINVSIEDEITIYIPTAFSPDFDNINETFIVKGNGIKKLGFSMLIYNRWGEEVFTSESINIGWDGRVRSNKIAQTGIYSYVIKYIDIYDVPHEKSGTFSLIR